jgi:8-oxo-dGTP pyrophosphatase MutT (NUDIX family)
LPEALPFRFIGERERYSNSFFTLVTGMFIDPSGFAFERDFVRHPGAVVIAPLENDGRHVLMVRQYRGSVNELILELPAGKLDIPGEALDVAAARELAEEVGKRAERINQVGQFLNSPGFTDELTTCFLAEGLSEVGRDSDGIEEEHMTVESVALDDIWRLAESGALIDGKTLLAISFVERALRRRSA